MSKLISAIALSMVLSVGYVGATSGLFASEDNTEVCEKDKKKKCCKKKKACCKKGEESKECSKGKESTEEKKEEN